MRGETINEGVPEEGQEWHDRVASQLQALQAHVHFSCTIANQRRRQAAVEFWCDQERDLYVEMFGQEPDIVTQVIHGHADILSQKVPTVITHLSLPIDEGIISRRVHFDLDLLCNLCQAINDWSHVLRQAAQGVTILNETMPLVAVLALPLRADQVLACQDIRHGVSGAYMTRMLFV